jgi:cAMP-dependent protein kinase regulator
MMETTTTKRATHTAFLENVPLLASLTPNERQTIADALKPVTFAAGETIIRQGDEGSTFFILEKGHVVCTAETDGVASEVGRLSPGHYFGEVALLTKRPRLASVTAVGEVSVLELDRRTFTRVLGPLTDVLKRNMAINAYIVAVGE